MRDGQADRRLRIGRLRQPGSQAPTAPAPPTLGDQPWFDIPARLLILALGLAHLILHPVPIEGRTLWIVLGIYSGATVMAALALIPAVRATIHRLGLQEGIDEAEPGILNFLLDSAFIIGITMLDPTATLLPAAMVLVAAARFFARNSG